VSGAFTPGDAVAIAGAVVLLAAYWMVSRRRIAPEGAAYHLMNLGGAALLLASLWVQPNHAVIVVEVLLAAVATTAILRLLR